MMIYIEINFAFSASVLKLAKFFKICLRFVYPFAGKTSPSFY